MTMTPVQKAEFRIALRRAFAEAIDEVGVDNFKRISWFGSSDSAFMAGSVYLKKAA